jgi:hypothetical protein
VLFYSDGFEIAFPTATADQYEQRLPTSRYIDEFAGMAAQGSPAKMIEYLQERIDAQRGSLHQVDDLTLLCLRAGPLGAPSRAASAGSSTWPLGRPGRTACPAPKTLWPKKRRSRPEPGPEAGAPPGRSADSVFLTAMSYRCGECDMICGTLVGPPHRARRYRVEECSATRPNSAICSSVAHRQDRSRPRPQWGPPHISTFCSSEEMGT